MITVNEIAKILEGSVVGDGTVVIHGVAKIEEASSGMLSFIANAKYEKYLETTAASAVLVSTGIDLAKHSKLPAALITVDDPYTSFVVAIEKFVPRKKDIDPGIHPTAVIHPTAQIGNNCSIGAYVVIGERVRIGDHSVIHPHVVVERDVTIGRDALLYSHCSVREECILGARVILQPGAVIGGDGFGFAPKKDGAYRKIPQLGIVVLEDDVEIQANTCVDRATLGETRIKQGTKIDNLVQIAHNVSVGQNTVIAGLTGIAGSTKIGNNNMIGGGVSITGHVFTADHVKVSGGTVATKPFSKQGETYGGFPGKESAKWRRTEGAIRMLPELMAEVRELQEKILEIQKTIDTLQQK